MTCREKLMLEHPEHVGSIFEGGCEGCPAEYGYISEAGVFKKECLTVHRKGSCYDCWNRPVENTESNTETITNIKGESIMNNNQDLFDMFMRSVLNATSEKPQKSPYEEAAEEMWKIYEAFKKVGFNDDRAFQLIVELIPAIIANMNNKE